MHNWVHSVAEIPQDQSLRGRRLVGWSLTSLFSTNMAISETKRASVSQVSDRGDDCSHRPHGVSAHGYSSRLCVCPENNFWTRWPFTFGMLVLISRSSSKVKVRGQSLRSQEETTVQQLLVWPTVAKSRHELKTVKEQQQLRSHSVG